MLCLLNSSAKVLNANKDLVVRDSAMQIDGVVIERVVIMTTWCSQPFKEVFGFLL